MKYLFLAFLFVVQLHTTTYYVDSDWTGTQSGTAAQPFRTITAQWATINTALASADVTIYFSARQAASDTEQIYSSTGSLPPDGIDTFNRTDNTAHVLTFNGRSFYNTSDSAPSWAAYSGTNKCRIKNFISQNDQTKHSNITIDGFHTTNPGDEKGVSIAGDNCVLQNCVMEGTGPGGNGIILLVPTADAAHEGSGAWIVACTNILIKSNIVFRSSGEAIYIGGGGSSPGSTNSGYPSHDQVTIEGNTISEAGYWDHQGDGIDVKGGITNLRIQGNIISNVGVNGGSFSTNYIADGSRAIVCQGLYNITTDSRQILGNIIRACTNIEDAAIALSDSWGVQKGSVIANNLINGITHVGHRPNGIKIYSTSGTITNGNNTIYDCAGFALDAEYVSSTILVEGNLFIHNNSDGAQVAYAGTVTVSDYNGYNGSIGYGGEGAHSFATTAVANFTTPGSVFTLITGATAIGKGTVLTSYTNDIIGATRTVPWDSGAYAYNGVVPSLPTLVSIAVTPATATSTVSSTKQFTSIGTYSDSSTQNITASCTWGSSDVAIATVNLVGLSTGIGVGGATITATKDAISGSGTLTVVLPVTISGKVRFHGRGKIH